MAKTIADLAKEAGIIHDENEAGENTASRVGTMFLDIIDYLGTLNTSSGSEDEGGSGGGGGGGVSLNEPLSSINNMARTPSGENKVLVYQNGTWTYDDYGGGSTPTSGVTWTALGAATSEPINLSHLTDALGNCSFWGRHPVNGAVSGDMTDVGSITMRSNGNDFKIELDANGDLKFNGNIYATGGVSALGNSSSGGGGGGGSTVIWNQIEKTGTKIATITINDEQPIDVYAPTSGGGGGATTLGGLNDVTLGSLALDDGQYLRYSNSDNKWKNAAFGPVIDALNAITNAYDGSYLLSKTNGNWGLTRYEQSSSGISAEVSGTGNVVIDARLSSNVLTLTKGTVLTSLPVASSTTLGGIKVGSHLAIYDGVLSVNGTGLSVTSATNATSAGQADRLSGSTTYSAWGQTYWQGGKPKDINGNMTGVNDIRMDFSNSSTSSHAIKMKCSTKDEVIDTVLLNNSDDLSFGYGARTNGLSTEIQGQKIIFAVNNSTPRVEAGEFTNTGLFHVKQGDQGIRIGDGVIKWNSSNNSLYVERAADAGGGAANFYASGGVSALGFSGGGSPSISSATIGTLNSTRINFAGNAGTWSIKTSFPGLEQLDFSYGGGGIGDRIVAFPNAQADKYFIGSSNRYLCWKNSHLVFNNGSSEIQIA